MNDNQENLSPTFMSIPRVSNKRKSYSIEDKFFFIQLITDGRKTQSEICNEYNICHSTLGTILSNKEKILSNYQNNQSCASRKRNRCAKHEDIERLLLEWYKETSSKKSVILNGAVMRAKAEELATLLNKKQEFKASNGWFQRFKIRNNIQFLSSFSGDDESLANEPSNKRAKIEDQRPNIPSNFGQRIKKPSDFALKNGSLSQLDEEEEEGEYCYSDELTSNSNSNFDQDNYLNQFKDDDDDDNNDLFNESEYFQVNSLEVPNRQEALDYLYKLRSYFELNVKTSANAMKSLNELENELLNE
jgi:transposase-like protein